MTAGAYQLESASSARSSERFMLWIDGVGGYWVGLCSRVTIGGPAHGGEAADLELLANLSRRHAALVRSGETYLLEPYSSARVAGRTIHEAVPLVSGYGIELGDGVHLTFRQPSVLSGTAVLEFASDHRPRQNVDGVVLMDETCLLGPGRENHIVCPDWPVSVVLFRRKGEFFCKSRGELFVSGQRLTDTRPMAPGDIVTGPDLRFRLEAL